MLNFEYFWKCKAEMSPFLISKYATEYNTRKWQTIEYDM